MASTDIRNSEMELPGPPEPEEQRPRQKAVTIGAVCKALHQEFPDISISKIRYLEDQKLLTPRRTQGGYRLYTQNDIQRLRTILRLQRDEFLPLRVIRQELAGGRSESDVATPGNASVTVTNPTPGGGTSPASIFTVDGFSLGGPSDASLTSGQPSLIQITSTPTTNGFTNPISFNISGLPAGASASFNPSMLILNGAAKPTMLTITSGSSAVSRQSAGTNGPGRLLEPLLTTCFVAILGWLYLRLQVRAIPLMRRYSALALLALVLIAGGILDGCALGVTSSPSTNTSQLTVTATSGTLTQTFGIALQVTR